MNEHWHNLSDEELYLLTAGPHSTEKADAVCYELYRRLVIKRTAAEANQSEAYLAGYEDALSAEAPTEHSDTSGYDNGFNAGYEDAIGSHLAATGTGEYSEGYSDGYGAAMEDYEGDVGNKSGDDYSDTGSDDHAY